ncbi:hypothetical protein K503DRAFT_453146 [Rhizopogon vinicolor AM-OR11-026]|uniref:Uncharacterized protein n=1 Tax=Rhizopogon vinicolor AM-OR11-026 TaxID=1314800 RepID=A0A1B7MP34_9AGAM|nr:hypothetical protein K503DRAFT_453146 [Rhizopogon vinicolor AM-OR11-026]
MSCAHCPSTLHHRELQMTGSASPFHTGSPRFALQYLARAKQRWEADARHYMIVQH